MRTARNLLLELTARFPPPVGRHHGLMLSDKDPEGLELMLHVGESWCSIGIEAYELDQDPTVLSVAIEESLRSSA